MGTAPDPGRSPADVVLLRWPADAHRREDLRLECRPRVWLVEGGAAAPDRLDWLEDWVRVPAAEADLTARTANIARRTGTSPDAGAEPARPPHIDADGVLRVGRGWVPLPPVEHRLTEALVERFGAVVAREALAAAGWPSGAPGRNALDVHMLRLRRRIRPLDLEIRTVRSRGYLLESATAGAGTATEPVANLA